jgi:hypothetical protein
MIKFKVIKPQKDAIMKAALTSLKKQISERLEGIECPEHHQHPQVTISGAGDDLKFNIEGCCQKLIEKAQNALQ